MYRYKRGIKCSYDRQGYIYFASRQYRFLQPEQKAKIRERVVEGSVDDEIKVQPGARVLDRSAYTAGSVVQYVRYLRRQPRKKRGGHKEGVCEDETEKQNA